MSENLKIDNTKYLARDSILKVGNVVSVEGRTVNVRVDKSKNVSHLLFNGEILKNISVGSYIKIRKGFEVIIGKIEGERVEENKFSQKVYYKDIREKIDRILEVKLIGFYDKKNFRKGIKELPLIDNECYLLEKTEYSEIHNFIKSEDIPLKIGVLSNDATTDISIGVNSLFASHIGIFGTTGSGKSYTLAKIYYELLNQFSHSEEFKENARFFLLDFNGEYIVDDFETNHQVDEIITSSALKSTYNLSTGAHPGNKYPMTEEEINDDTLWTIASEATEKTQTPFIRRALRSTALEQATSNGAAIGEYIFELIESMAKSKVSDFLPVINALLKDISDVLGDSATGIEAVQNEIAARLKYNSNTYDFYIAISRPSGTVDIYSNNATFSSELRSIFQPLTIDIQELGIFKKTYLKIILNFYLEISRGYSNREHIAPMLKRLEKRVYDLDKVIRLVRSNEVSEKLMTIVSLKNVNIHMRKILPLLLCKKLYEVKKHEADRTKYLNIIIDEAHNILSEQSLRENESWRDYRLETFEEIIKEGRKFGTFLTIASQRPFDISPTIISQLHNYFLHRLINEKDLKAIENTVSFLDKISFESLPILPVGSCILSGIASQVPVIIDMGELPQKSQPNSETYKPTDNW